MQFTTRKRRQAPAVIIVSLIDVLIVVLIFLVSTTTFKKQRAVELSLPESAQAAPGESSANRPMVIEVTKTEPFLHLNGQPITATNLLTQLKAMAATNPAPALAIRADDKAPFGEIIKAMDAAKAAGIKSLSAYTKTPAQ